MAAEIPRTKMKTNHAPFILVQGGFFWSRNQALFSTCEIIYVLRFSVRTEFLSRYEIHVVGSSEHQEYWIPAEDLQKLNENIVGPIEVVSEFRDK